LEFRHISHISGAITDKRIVSDEIVAQYVLFSDV